jgi:hypothetical protein
MANKKAIIKEMWDKAPKAVKKYAHREGAIIVSMAAGLLAAPAMDECGKVAVQDMAHELNYTWDPFDGFCA